MRITTIFVALGVALGTTAATGQQNQSVDPAWLNVPERLGDVQLELTEPVMSSDIPVRLMLVELDDGVYAPIGLRKPEGAGPFPTIVFAHMNGGLGIRWIREWTNYGSGTLEAFLRAGYAVVWMRYRAEVDTPWSEPLRVREFQGRQRFTRGPQEFEDAIRIIEFVKSLPEVDPNRVGYMSVSHGSEMLMKIASQYNGLAAGVATEPASTDFLARRPRDPNAPPEPEEPETLPVNTPDMQREAVAALRARIDEQTAMERIDRIQTPIFVVGRDRDHNQETFRLNYELLEEAGKTVQWKSFDHDHHGFAFIQRNADGVYDPDPIQREVVADSIAWFDRFLKGASQPSPVLEYGETAGGDWVFD
jgi:dipeptidyl aminopeptidase/acylaminoacyl peptidase